MELEPNRFFNTRHRLRISNPPGGRTNDIFNTSSNESTPTNSPQKKKNYSKSQVFVEETDANGNVKARSVSPRHNETTKERIFGTPESSPRRKLMSDTYKSKIFVEDGTAEKSKICSPKKKPPIVNTITGEIMLSQNGCEHNDQIAEDCIIVENGHHDN